MMHFIYNFLFNLVNLCGKYKSIYLEVWSIYLIWVGTYLINFLCDLKIEINSDDMVHLIQFFLCSLVNCCGK